MINGQLRHSLLEKLELLNSDDPEVIKSFKTHLMLHSYSDYSVFVNRLFKKISCHEFSPVDGKTVFFNGRLIPDPEDETCKDEVFDRPYDSVLLLTSSPIYYIAGTNDPAAPFEGAIYHFKQQVLSRRNFIKVPGGGHNFLGETFPDCKDEIWEAILNQDDLVNVLEGCKAEVELIVK